MKQKYSELKDKIRKMAEEIMKNGDPVGYIINQHQKMHVGDRNTALILLISIALQSARNSKGIQPKVSGESGKGKTHCCKAMKHLIPEQYIIEATLSDKAIYRMNLEQGTVIFSDDVDLSLSMVGTIKRATTNFQEETIYTTVNKDHEATSLSIPSRTVCWFTSVDEDLSIQLLNRQFSADVDESPEQDKKVLEFQIQQAMSGQVDFPLTEEVMVCREIIEIIKEQEFIGITPFAEDIEWSNPENRRNFPMFNDLMMAFAILRFKQRNYDKETGILNVDIEDFYSASELYNSRARNQNLKTTKKEDELLEAIINSGGRATYAELSEKLDVSYSRISHLLHGKEKDSGLINKIPGLSIQKKDRTYIVFELQEQDYEVKLKAA